MCEMLMVQHNFEQVDNQFGLIDDSSYGLNFDLGRKNEIHHYRLL